jgi:anti-anti-sigma regulatory factor
LHRAKDLWKSAGEAFRASACRAETKKEGRVSPATTSGLRNGWSVITVTGEFTAQTRASLRAAFLAARERPYVVADISVADFRGPGDFDSFTFGRRVLRNAGGELRLVHPSEIVGRAVDTLVPEQTFPVYRDLAQATAAAPAARDRSEQR